jgi:hypothetical protein
MEYRDTRIPMPEHEHDTEPSHHSPVNPKIYPLLIEEEEARRELNANIDYLLKEDCQPSNTKHLLQAFKNYMSGIKELTDIIKQGHG